MEMQVQPRGRKLLSRLTRLAEVHPVPLIPPETIEQIAASNDIVEVISGYIPLKRAAVLWKALCPFHQERSPSFSVNPQRQIFKCFGCGAGGSVIRFVMTYENLDFISAAKKLANRAGIKIVEAEMSAEDTARYGMRRRLLALHAEAAEFFRAQLLKKASAQVAREYLKGRGIGAEIAKSWKIGYAPDSFEAFTEFAQGEGFTTHELVESGLVKLRDEEQTPSLPVAHPCSDRLRCAGRESNFLADKRRDTHLHHPPSCRWPGRPLDRPANPLRALLFGRDVGPELRGAHRR